MVDLGETSSRPTSSEMGGQRDFQAFSEFFRKAMGFHGIPQGRLAKFRGAPTRPRELTLAEWLDEFNQVVAPYQLTDREKVQVLVDHLGGDAKEEVMCLPEASRLKYEEVVKALQLCFKTTETLQTLNGCFHTRIQGEGESLTDFSWALMRLYGKMEAAAPSQTKLEALRSLRDSSLKDQFSQGAKEVWVRRELRRIVLANPEADFQKIREEALLLFQDARPQRQVRVREVQAEMVHSTMDQASPQPSLL